MHLEENISNLDISGIFDFTPTNSIRKKRKGSSTYCTIEELENEPASSTDIVADNKVLTKNKEMCKDEDATSITINSKNLHVMKNEKSKASINGENYVLTSHYATIESKNENKNIIISDFGATSNLSTMNGSNNKLANGNMCEIQSSIRPSPLRIQNSGDDKTHRISSSSHALNNINSYSVINNVSPSLATDIAHMPIQPHLDNDTGPPNRLLRSSSTSTCSALYSPLLKVRQNNDLRFQQQKGRYSDTIRYSDSICARYF